MQTNVIYNEDCIAGLNKIDDKSIDMILCDLPYGITGNKWDVCLPLDQLWSHYKRIIKDRGIIVLTAQDKFAIDLIVSNREMYKYKWIWEKSRPAGFLHANNFPLRIHEEILVFL